MRKLYLFIWLFVAVILSACTDIEIGSEAEGFVYENEGVEIPFSLSVGDSRPQTKMTQDVTQVDQSESSFRGIKEIYAIPFKVKRAINGSDERVGKNLALPQLGIPSLFGASAEEGAFAGLVSNNNSHLYKGVIFPRGTASLLVYGQAIDEDVSVSPDSIAFKRRNGVLCKHGVEKAETPADITFTLEPFISSAQEAEMQTTVNGLLTYLNNIAGATVSLSAYTTTSPRTPTTWTYNWMASGSYNNYADLKNAFVFFTSDGKGFSGATDAINQMLTSLYNKLYSMATDDEAGGNSYRQGYRNASGSTVLYYYYVYQLAREIRTLIDNSTYVTLSGSGANVTVSLKGDYANFPERFGLPSGSVGIVWNGTAFVQQTSATGAALAAADAFCYPPSLWYGSNSTLKTSDDMAIVEEYKSANATWNDIFNQYTFGDVVVPGALSAALKDPLQYGVAMLQVELNYAQSTGGTQYLPDSEGNDVDVRNSNFPLTGIIIGEQKNQSYAFEPLLEGLSLYVYDNEVYDGSTPKAYIAGASSGLTFQPVHTLVVQTEDAKDIHMALEFQNNSGADFYGFNSCRIAAGSKFYLIAKLKYANGTGASLPAVFVHDHITKVTFSINSLANAHNTIPELRDPQLEIGVVAQIEWVQATPAEIPMY